MAARRTNSLCLGEKSQSSPLQKQVTQGTNIFHSFQGFVRSGLLAKHSETCQHLPVQATTMVDQEIKFTHWARTEETLFRVYGDFECVLKDCEEEDINGKTVKTQKHIP